MSVRYILYVHIDDEAIESDNMLCGDAAGDGHHGVVFYKEEYAHDTLLSLSDGTI